MKSAITLFAVAGLSVSAHGGLIAAQWNFNSNPADGSSSTGSLLASAGDNAASASLSLLGGLTSTFASGTSNGGSSDPALTDNTGLNTTNFAAQGTGSGTRGVQFNASTVGFDGVVVSWDLRFSNTSSRYLQFQYTTDRTASTPVWVAAGGSTVNGVNNIITGASAGDTWLRNISVDLSSAAGVASNANFAFRIVAVFDPNGAGNQYTAASSGSSYGTASTWRFDLVTVVPTPGSAALIALGGLMASRRRRGV
ncbi:MAG: PEP-CTERM sorting domain-containing protein [Phycisphaerales bacterium]|nr:PEP-CTERM sorting domain-containing protein [Phycisphaerales bacterium]